jgi:hypothetical protein
LAWLDDVGGGGHLRFELNEWGNLNKQDKGNCQLVRRTCVLAKDC